MKKGILLIVVSLLGCSGDANKMEKENIIELKATKNKLLDKEIKLVDMLSSVRDSITNIDLILANKEVKYQLVDTISVKQKTFKHFIIVKGIVDTEKNIDVKPELTGTIKKIIVEEGAIVKKGQILCELDHTTIDNNIEEIKIGLELARETFKKQSSLWENKMGSEMQYLQAKANKESLESKLASLISQRDKMIIKAEFGGTIDEIYVKEGEVATNQTRLLRLVSLEDMYVEADISEKYTSDIKIGAEVIIRFTDSDIETKTVINKIGKVINRNNRSFKVRAYIKNKLSFVIPNLTVSVLVKNYERENAIVIPSNIINVDIDENKYVYSLINKDGVFVSKKRIIKIEKEYKGESLVSEGLTEGDIVVFKGYERIKDNQKVTIYGN